MTLNYAEVAETYLDQNTFNYRPGSYHCLRKRELNDLTDEKAQVPYYKHKLHIGINLKENSEHFDAVWKLLIEIFKEECIYEVKLIDEDLCAETPDKVQDGKEATIYFSDRQFTGLSEEKFLANHIKVIQKIDARIQELGLPISIKPKEDHETEDLGCNSGAVFIAPPDHEGEKYIRGEQRGEFVSPYSQFIEKEKEAKQVIDNIERNIQLHPEWELGIFGGESIRINDKNLKVPFGVKQIFDDIQKTKTGELTSSEALILITEKLGVRKNYHEHGFFNKRYDSTQRFYDDLYGLITDKHEQEGIALENSKLS